MYQNYNQIKSVLIYLQLCLLLILDGSPNNLIVKKFLFSSHVLPKIKQCYVHVSCLIHEGSDIKQLSRYRHIKGFYGMDVYFNSVFDFHGITQTCWQTCDANDNVNAYRIDPSIFPKPSLEYRDNKTRPKFLEVAEFFGCVDVCQSTNESNRLQLLFPIGLGCKLRHSYKYFIF